MYMYVETKKWGSSRFWVLSGEGGQIHVSKDLRQERKKERNRALSFLLLPSSFFLLLLSEIETETETEIETDR